MILFYLALWSTSNNPAKRFAAGQVASLDRSSSVGTTVDEALEACAGWPVHLYEAEAAPDDDAKEDPSASIPCVKQAVIVRALSQEEVFGPKAADLEAFLSELPRVPWLAPVGPPDMARITELIQAHYSALAEFAPVEVPPPRLVHDWRQAHWQQRETFVPSASGYPHAVDLFLCEQRHRTRKIVLRRVAQMAAYHMTYLCVWEAAWRIASADRVHAEEDVHADAELARRRLDQVREEFLAAIEHRGKGAWETAAWLVGLHAPSGGRPGAPNDGLPPESLLRRVHATTSEELLQSVWSEVFGAANAVLNRAADVAADIINPPEKPNPTAPLYEMTRLGYWPLGEVAGRFLVFAPPPEAS